MCFCLFVSMARWLHAGGSVSLGRCTYSHVNHSFAGFLVPGAQHMLFKEKKSLENQGRGKGSLVLMAPGFQSLRIF